MLKSKIENKKVKKSYVPWLTTLFKAKTRCNSVNNRYHKRGIKCFLTQEEIKTIWFRDKAYLLKHPSIDRIDNNGNYIFDNCRYIELSENSRLGNLGRKQSTIQIQRRREALRKTCSTPEFLAKLKLRRRDGKNRFS